ncbi:hypothetical protein CCR94_09795 [Rhodoblastus sphagnicola]|uniref:Uncharacterized protein n=1 Tax=Rhodoblastus sphagnicola TaxID=333368 RepID=A0A2S6N9H5_9HYPH|nr:hypothetical protein [Rhodoblastus sphagnicola]MBB4196937.1 hypothetical protein [Rhodoblastus sphagnicola]PPQ31265.1 hypothetical protein CCR94_09795 [Rhodoblastus sphagnicola]
MDTPQLKRIDPYARVSAAARSDESRTAHGSREFTALIIGEDAGGRRRSRHAPDEETTPDDAFAAQMADATSSEDARPGEAEPESIIETRAEPDAEDVLPEDAHGPQELRSLLTFPHE